MGKQVIITGGAGFIGSHLVDRLLEIGGWEITVIDNYDHNYPRSAKDANIAGPLEDPAYTFIEGDILDDAVLEKAFAGKGGPETVVIHLAAKVGVRPSIAHPLEYHRVNVTGTLKVLEAARSAKVGHFILASSSSVYGLNPNVPWEEDGAELQPISPYAVSKLAAEQFARTYARLHGLNTTVLRFFTVYGPRQRPDLAIHSFFNKIIEGSPIKQFGDGNTGRDYTYVNDIVRGICSALERPLEGKEGAGAFNIFNLGNSKVVLLSDLIAAIEHQTGKKAIIEQHDEQPGDVPNTCASLAKSKQYLGYEPTMDLENGLSKFHEWYMSLSIPQQ